MAPLARRRRHCDGMHQMWLSAVGVTPRRFRYAVNPWRGIRLVLEAWDLIGLPTVGDRFVNRAVREISGIARLLTAPVAGPDEQ